MSKPAVMNKPMVACPFCTRKPYIRIQALRTHILSKHKDENDEANADNEQNLNRENSVIKEAALIQDIFDTCEDNDLEANLGFNDNILNIGHDDILTYALPAAIEPTECDYDITKSNDIENLTNTAQRFIDEYSQWKVPPHVKGTMIVDSEAPVKVPLTASAAAFLTRSQMKLVLPSLNMTSDLEVVNPVICAECRETFSTLEAGNEHVESAHHSESTPTPTEQASKEKYVLTAEDIKELEGQLKCELCSYTACYSLDMLLHKGESTTNTIWTPA